LTSKPGPTPLSTGSSAPTSMPSPTTSATAALPTLPSPTVSPKTSVPMSIPSAYEGMPATNFPTLPSPTVSPKTSMPMSIPPAYEALPTSESLFASSGSFQLSATVMSVLSTMAMAATMLWL
jgi:hypothetical protein